jgi:23S rRNA maturation-related 3'-5' exoribonuclease YhaM
MEDINYLKSLMEIASRLGVVDDVAPVLNDERFEICAGASHSDGHHYGDGGLVQHTWEVVSIALRTADLYQLSVEDKKKLFIAAVWHDYGKIWDYEKLEDVASNGRIYSKVWIGTEHRQRIRHLTRSAIEWEKFADTTPLAEETRDEITHAILSHHGDFEGNPHPPQTTIAWILHLSDNMSARVTDAINGRWEFKPEII